MTDLIDRFEGKFSFLSNFAPSPVWPDWWPRTLPPFPTVEHAYQASKVGQSGDWLHEVEQIRTARTAGQAKRLGRKVQLDFNWNDGRVGEMRALIRDKFIGNPQLGGMLLALTGDARLVEGNHWHDNFWGDCWCDRCKDTPGKNMLGELLMELREEVRNG